MLDLVYESFRNLEKREWKGDLEYDILIAALAILQIYKMESDNYIIDTQEALSAYCKMLRSDLMLKEQQIKGKDYDPD